MKLEFEDGSFLELEQTTDGVEVIQCAQSGREALMMVSRLTLDQVEQLVAYLKGLQ